MSRTVDERVVSMQFDNAAFEKNVGTTLSTLDKLKHALKLDGVANGLDDIGRAAKKCDVSPLQQGIETIGSTFSATRIMAEQFFRRITDDAISTGKRMVKSLTVDNVAAGFDKYNEKTQSIQTLVNSTGKSVEEINGYLSELMWYSDETSYGFTDMTSALASMTSTGGDINKLIPMIEGMANATAFAGKGASEFNRVIYNLQQSYSQGFLSLMDWKSVQGAGAASKQLISELIAAGEELGTIKKGQVTEANFTNTLASKWANTEVMERAFGKFSALTQEAYKAVEAGEFETAADAIDALSGKYDELAVRAFRSAQEAKSFSDAIDATKDAVGSGWMNTFEIIFGSYDEAKETWTQLANDLWDIFASGADARNEFLGGVFGEWNTFAKDSIENAGLSFETITDALEAGAEKGKTATEVLDKLSSKLLKNGKITEEQAEYIRNLNSNIAIGIDSAEEYLEAITPDSGRHALADVMHNIALAVMGLQGALREAFGNIFQGEYVMNFADFLATLRDFTAALNIYTEVEDEAAEGEEVLTSTGEKLRNTFQGVLSVLHIGITVFKDVIDIGMDLANLVLKPLLGLLLNFTSNVGSSLTDISNAFYVFNNDVMMAYREALAGATESFGNFLDKFKNTALVQRAIEIYGKAASKVKELWNALLFPEIKKFGDSISSSGIVNFLDGMFQSIIDFANSDFAVNTFNKIVESIKSFFTMMSNLQLPKIDFNGIIDFFKNLGNKGLASATNASKSVMTNVTGFFSSLGPNIEKGIGIAKNVFKAIADFITGGKQITFDDIVNTTKSILGFVMLFKALKSFSQIGDSISGAFDAIGEAVESYAKNKKYTGLGEMMKGLALAVAALAGSLYVISTLMGDKNLLPALGVLGAMLLALAGVIYVLAKIDITGKETLKVAALAALSLGLALAVAVLAKVLMSIDSYNFQNLGQTVMIMLGAILMLVTAIKIIGKVVDTGTFKTIAALVVMLKALRMLTGIIKKYQNFDWAGNAGGVIAVMLMLFAMAKILQMSSKGLGDGAKVTGLGTLVLALVVMLLAILKPIEKLSQMFTTNGSSATAAVVSMIAIIGVIFAGLVFLTKNASGGVLEKGQKSVNSFKGLASLLLTITGMIVLFAMLPGDMLVKGGIVLAILLGIMGTFYWAINKIGSADTKSLVTAIAGMVLVLGEIGVMLYFLSTMDPAKAIGGALAIGIVLLALAGAVKLAEKSLAGGGAILMLGLGILALAGALAVIASIPVDKITQALVGFVAILVALGVAAGLMTLIGPALTPGIVALGLLGVAALIVGAAVLVAAFGLNVLAVAITALAPALAELGKHSEAASKGAMIVLELSAACFMFALALAGIAAAIYAMGLAMTAGSIGFLSFGGMILMVAASVAIAAGGLYLLSGALGVLAEPLKKFADTNWLGVTAGIAVLSLGCVALAVGLGVVSVGVLACALAFGVLFAVLAAGIFITSGIASIFESLGGNIVGGLLNGIISAAGGVFTAIGDMAHGIVEGFCNVLGIHSPSKVMEMLAGFVGDGVVKGLNGSSGKVESASSALADIVASVMGDSNKDAKEAGDSTGTNYFEGLTSSISSMSADGLGMDKITDILGDVGGEGGTIAGMNFSDMLSSSANGASFDLSGITSQLGMAGGEGGTEAGESFISQFGIGLDTGSKQVKTTASKIAESVVSVIRSFYSKMQTAGNYLGDGLTIGIYGRRAAAYNAGYELGKAAVDGEKEGQESNSPSKATIQAGKWLGDGLIIGIGQMGKAVYDAGKSMGEKAVDPISNAVNRIASTMDTDIDYQPTIRPILDLSDIADGASSINDMLSFSTPIGVLSNINAINSSMMRRQNGTEDVVSAINSLGKNMNQPSGDTYNINGITYDDGSNITDAVKTLVRAATVERRR